MRGFGAAYRPLAAGNPPRRLVSHDIICLHTMVGYLTSTYDYFAQNGWSGTESHFGVGGKWGRDASRGLDGAVWQFVDTDYQADANLDGNDRVISIETADNAPSLARDIEPWTPAQFEAIAQLVAKLCRTYDIPPVLIPDTKQGRRGIAYHQQGVEHSLGVGKVAGFLVAGGERWSTATGKECPGPRRIAQIPALLVRVAQILHPAPVVPAPTNPGTNDTSSGSGAGSADGSDMGTHEVLTYDGKAYERQGFFLRYIPTLDELKALEKAGVPSRSSSAGELAKYPKVDQVVQIASDARAATVALQSQVDTCGDALEALEAKLADLANTVGPRLDALEQQQQSTGTGTPAGN